MPKERLLIPAALLAFALKLAFALMTAGTNDVYTWELFDRKLHASGARALYQEGVSSDWQSNGKSYTVSQPFNHPPFMLHMLKAWRAAAAVSGIPFRAWLRITAAVADLAMLWLLLGVLRAEKIPANLPVLLAVALSPVSVLVSGFHGNTDPVMIALVLLSVYLIATRRPAWMGGAALGLAMCIKVVPVIFLPVILLYLGSMRRRVAFSVAAVAVFLAASMPYLAQDPALILRGVFAYSPIAGFWGFAELALLISDQALAAYLAVGKVLALGAVLAASVWMRVRAPRCPLVLQCGLIAFLFLFLASGFGVQYLAWLVPWIAALPWRGVRWHYVVVAADVILYYGAYSRWRWYEVNTFNYAPPTIGLIGMMHLACWISVGGGLVLFVNAVKKRGRV